MQKAAKKSDEQGYIFKFTDFYEKGQEVWFVLVTNYLHTKETLHCRIRTIYSNAMVCNTIDKEGSDVIIPIQDRSRVFNSEQEAKKAAKKIKA